MEEMTLKSKIITTWEIKLASTLFGIKARQGKDDISFFCRNHLLLPYRDFFIS